MGATIGIAGAGIGGLAAAALLARAGHDVDVFDAFAAPAPVGSGLVIQPVGQAVLDRIGAGAAARAAGRRITHMLGVEAARGRRVLDVAYDPAGRRHGLAIHRAALFDALHAAALAAGARLHPASRIVAAPREGAGRSLVTDTDARHGPFDLAVDATGAGSPLSPMVARPLAYGALWGTVPWPAGTPLPTDRLSQRYSGASRMAGVLPVGTLPGDPTPRAAIFWSLRRDAHAHWRARPLGDWTAEAVALWPDFAPFLETVTRHDDLTMARYAHGTLGQPWAPGLAHIGDAAHRSSPQLGQGANMALLDALALVRALDRLGPRGAPAAYARMRARHVAAYQRLSALFTPQYQSDSRILPVIRDRVLMPVSRIPPVPGILSRLVCGDLLPPIAGP